MKKLMMVAAATVAAWSWGAESISVDKVANHYPWDGKVDCVVTLSGTEVDYSYDGVFTLSVKKDGATVSRVVTNELANVDGVYTNVFDCTALFGAGHYPNGGISVVLVKKEKPLDGVQLWEDGPYWAEYNVGATKPGDYGYYFWWGDTIGYKRNAAQNGWISSKDGTAVSFNDCSTHGKTIDDLLADGYIDGITSNLVAKHDAAAAYFGNPWRMPTNAELDALVANCTVTWIDNWKDTAVRGRLFTGKGEYSSKSIFLPATGEGVGSDVSLIGTYGYYWSSSPSSNSNNARYLAFASSQIAVVEYFRARGRSVRPVRSAK